MIMSVLQKGDSMNKEIIKENRDSEVPALNDKLLIKSIYWFYFKNTGTIKK
jgi:hypothetical protein